MNTFRRLLLILCLLTSSAAGSAPSYEGERNCGLQLQSSNLSGVWEGTLHAFGQDVRLIYKITVSQDGTLSASHDSPDYALNNIPVAEAKIEGERLTLRIGLYDAVFEGTVGKNVIKGRYRSAPNLWLPLALKRRSEDPGFLLNNMAPRLGAAGRKILDYRYLRPEQCDDGWDVANAALEGLDTSKIAAMMRRVLAGDPRNLHSIVLVKDGKIILEEYFHAFHRDKPHRISSVSKVITAAAVGVAVDRGLIKDIHTPLHQILPEYADILGSGQKTMLTLHHLLTMTTGLQWDEHATDYFDPRNDLAVMKKSADRLRNLFERPLLSSPGERFVYNSGCMIALEEVLMRITKSHPLLFVQNELLTPMGISNYRWEEGEGYFMVPRDMAKLGLLFHRRGEYNGTRVLSAAWADSALRGYEPNAALYFNHWSPIVHFADGIPVKGLVAGGWGGQSITIFPALNTIVVMTGGNMLEPADYDVCIREYILPAILTPRYRKAHAESAYQQIRRSGDLEWTAHWDTEMGCLSACAKSLGRPVTDSRLYGATGVGFLINIDERAEPKSMAVWNKDRMYELCRNLGFTVESIWSHKSNKDFSATQRLVWDRVRREIDGGHACYGFHLGTSVRYLITGYDDCGYYYKGWQAECEKGPVRWEALGQTTIGLLGMHYVSPVASNVPLREMVKEALQFVLEFSANSPQWVPGDCKAGPEGFERWISLLESGQADEYGLSYNAAQLAEARRFAVDFLGEAKAGLGPGLGLLVDQALRFYKSSARNLERLSQTFPHDVLPAQRTAHLKDPQRRQEALRCLREARDAEVEGLKALAAIAEKL